MRNLQLVIIACLTTFFVVSPARAADLDQFATWHDDSTVVVDHSAWGTFLQTYLVTSFDDGVTRVRYGSVSQQDHDLLTNYISILTSKDPTTLGKAEAFSYWANLYNALTVMLILDHYPVDSIREIKPSIISTGPWKQKIATVARNRLSLDDIEHGILRAHWADPRVHYALNCASIGCPNLRADPFSGAALEMQLNEAAHDYINHPRGVHVDDAGRLTVSSIYKWFQEDFGGEEQGVINHFLAYADAPLTNQLRSLEQISGYEYNWMLNDAR